MKYLISPMALPGRVLTAFALLTLSLAGLRPALVHAGEQARGNGIIVGKPKLYDEHALRQMLRTAEANLAKLQFSNQEAVAAAIGRTQGATLDATAQSFQLTPLPIPGVKRESTNESGTNQVVGTVGGTTTSGTTNNGSTTSTTTGSTTNNSTVTTTTDPKNKVVTTVTDEGFKFQAPTLLPVPTALNPVQVNGIAAHDLLAEQEALNYQVINLRLLLQGALTDRLTQTSAQIGGQQGDFYGDRIQAVVGLNVTLDPPHRYKNRVAEVVVTVTPPDPPAGNDFGVTPGTGAPASTRGSEITLVAVSPKQRTYNVAAVRRSAKSIGLGAVVQMFSLGYSGSRSRETVYLVKDTDTVALERYATEKPRALSFGWQFRPTLGRSVVDPGMREVFAVLSIPKNLLGGKTRSANVHVTTRWREFHKSSKIAGEPEPDSDAEPFESAGVSLPLLPVTVRDTQLRPQVLRTRWDDLGNGSLLVSVEGRNFAPETRVQAGTTTLGSTEVTLQGDTRLLFQVPAAVFLQRRIELVGSYGPPQPLFGPLAPDPSLTSPPSTLKVKDVQLTPVSGKAAKLSLQVKVPVAADGDPSTVALEGARDAARQILVNLGGTYYGVAGAAMERRVMRYESEGGERWAVLALSLLVPTEALLAEDEISVELLHGAVYHRVPAPFPAASPYAYDFLVAPELEVRPDGRGGTLYVITGRNFRRNGGMERDGIRAIVKGVEIHQNGNLVVESPTQLRLHLTNEQAKDLKAIVLEQGPDSAAVRQRSVATPTPTPTFVINDPVIEGDREITVTATGSRLSQIKEVRASGVTLVTPTDDPAKRTKLEITLPSVLTEKPGRLELVLIGMDGKAFHRHLLTVQARPKGG